MKNFLVHCVKFMTYCMKSSFEFRNTECFLLENHIVTLLKGFPPRKRRSKYTAPSSKYKKDTGLFYESFYRVAPELLVIVSKR